MANEKGPVMPPNPPPEPVSPRQEVTPSPASIPTPTSPPPIPQEELPDPWKWFRQVIFRWLGLPGLILVAVLSVVWSNWSTVKDLPGVATIRTWVCQAPLPKADPQRFAVALAHLEGDKDHQYERFIREV